MSGNQYILSLDLGTQGTKAALVTLEAEVIESEFSSNKFEEYDDGAILLQAEALINSVADVTKRLLEKAGVLSENIVGIGVVGMMAGIVGIDQCWNPVTYYDSGLDKRCESAIEEMQELGEERVISLCGSPIIVAQGAKMYWWKQMHPEVFQRVAKFIPASTYVCGCMAGLNSDQAFIDYTHIHLTCLADVEKGEWSKELLTLYSFPEEKLPRIVSPCEIIGYVTKRWSKKTGLRSGIPIVAGCGDTAASAFGAGLTKQNMLLDVAGTASCLLGCVSEYRPDVEKKILINQRSVIPGLWTPFGFVLGGQTLGWYFDQINYDGKYRYDALAHETEEIENQSLYFLPYFAGRICPSDAGFSGHWIGLKFYHGRAHMFKSIMESIAYEYRFYFNRLRQLYPAMNPGEMLTSAGGARIEQFSRLKSDILNLPVVTLKQKDTSHKAAAIITGYALGFHKDLALAAEEVSRRSWGKMLNPDEKKVEKYSGNYEKYRKIVSFMGELHNKIEI